jgi:cellulose synthase/poly-beta-1,6-N-acetylglucosamine synthase-like glycosyltransferase
VRTHIAVDIFFLLSVTIIWFMVGYQLLLFMFGHWYYRRTREGSEAPPPLSDADCPGVSILIPCHNEERVIAHTIRALLALDYPIGQIEIVVIDDGSTDRTGEIARTFDSVARV